jgi:hypothetical protein
LSHVGDFYAYASWPFFGYASVFSLILVKVTRY